MHETNEPPDWGTWFSTAHSTKMLPHRHPGTEFNLVTAGSIRYLVDGREVRVEAGQLIFIPAQIEHELVWVQEDAALWVVESPVPFSEDVAPEVAVWDVDERWFFDFCRIARKLWLRPSAAPKRQLLWDMQALLKNPVKTSEPIALRTPHEAVSRARSLCELQLSADLDVGDLARRAGISASRLAHLFQEQVGISPVQYKNFVRVQHFIRCHEQGKLNLLQAALAAGFGSYAQFHRVFRQVCGVGPHAHLAWLGQSPLDAKRTLGVTALSA